MSDQELADLKRRLDFGRPADTTKNPPGGVVYPDEADAILPEIVADLIEARAGFMRRLQWSNDCRTTGELCRDAERCGCFLEMQRWCRSTPVQSVTL